MTIASDAFTPCPAPSSSPSTAPTSPTGRCPSPPTWRRFDADLVLMTTPTTLDPDDGVVRPRWLDDAASTGDARVEVVVAATTIRRREWGPARDPGTGS